MKKIFYIFAFFLILGFTACEHTNYQTYTLKSDYTGYYFNIEGIDYQICNDSMVSKFKNGVKIEAVVKRIDSCNNWSGIVCGLYHRYEGFIYIEKTKY